MKMKRISLLICFCFLFSTPIIFVSGNSSNIIIVDNEGDGNYTSIKDALLHATQGCSIEVYSGTYYEYSIVIEIENITLKGFPYEFGMGNDIGKPFIDGPGTDQNALIDIKAHGVTIDGFHIENYKGESTGNVCIGIDKNADECIISNNDLFYSLGSLIWVFSSYNTIFNNNISNSILRNGITLSDPSDRNVIRSNKISDCDTGILTWGSGNNLIENNIVQNCVSYGMDIGNSDNVVRYNTIKNNTIGIQLMSIRTIVSNNNFINNEKYHATAYNSRLSWLISNRWIGNFWDRGRVLPYPILCQFFIFPWIEFDWNPAKVPNSMS